MSFRSAVYIFLICSLGAQAGLGGSAAQTADDDDVRSSVADDTSGDDNASSGDVDAATRVCLPDNMEDNDSQATASPVTPGVFTGLTSCARDDDFYTFAVAEDEAVTATVTFEHLLGDIDVALLAPTGAVIENSNSFTDDEAIGEALVPAAGDYTLRVRRVGSPGNDYDMEIIVGPAPPPPVCPADAFEPNNAAGSALPITDGHHASLHVCELDDDWYSIRLLADTEVTVDAIFLDTEGDLEMQLRSPTGTLLVVADSTTDNETLGPYTTTVAGDYQLRIYLNGDDGVTLGNEYSLDVSIGMPAICPVDAFEENDTDTAAALLAQGTHTGLHVCNSDADWYLIPLVAGAVLTVESTFSHAEGDLDLSLQRSSGRVVARAGTGTDKETLGPFRAPVTDDYYLEIPVYNDTGSVVGNSYDLEVTID
jgi:subtilisin-like proprotein convertase family protein